MISIARVFFVISFLVVAGCSASQPSVPQAFSDAGASARTARSWIDPAAKSGALLYVTGGGDVDVFQWPALQTAGVLTGFQQTTGACVDAAGDVWIADAYAQKLYEYAHGGTAPIATLDDTASFPNGCTVNKRNGDLAVGNEYSATIGKGSITVYKHASGQGTIYYDSGLDDVFSLDYGPKGNIFLDGWTGYAFGMASFANRQFDPITISGATIGYPGGVQYWKNTLTVADAGSTVTHTTIYQISTAGKVLGETTLGQAYQSYQYEIRHGQVICACYEDKNVQIYPYPAGGTPTRTVTKFKGVRPWAAVVSTAVKIP
ncbi:MAG TPA: hypothetical protein VN936_01955 [Candidatus Acidoferrum sp.]|nr:hypothetical protein [Candidatus Acidoferrum sp.]